MLTLYHAGSSVCSQTARVGLAEKRLAYESAPLDLAAGDQFKPDYMKLNPNAVVPTLVDDGKAIIESSVILQYADAKQAEPRLTPADLHRAARMRIWLLRTVEIHGATNSLSFATSGRAPLMTRTPAEREAHCARMPDLTKREKRRDLVEKGVASHHVDEAIRTFRRMFADMEADLAVGPWLLGGDYSLADAGLIGHVDRLDRLGLSGFWARHPRVGAWFDRSRARPSYAEAIEAFIDHAAAPRVRELGSAAWPIVERKLAE